MPSTSRTFGFGWKPNTQDDSHGPSHVLFAAEPYLLPTPDMRAIARDPSLNGYHLDQGAAGSCWGFATTRNLQCFYGARGLAAPLASPRFTYWNARNEEYAGQPPVADRKLDDTGTEPRLGLRALSGLGYVAWDDCPYSDDPRIIAARPVDDTYQLAYTQEGLVYASVNTSGRVRVDAVADALRKGFPVQIGMMLDQAFMDWNPSKGPIRSIDTNHLVGRHMMAVLFVDYDAEVVYLDNQWTLDGVTPWGTPEGFVIVSFTLFGSSVVSDVAAIKFAPALRRR